MILDIRTLYIAMAATCFIVAAGLFALQARRLWRDDAFRWTLGWDFQGCLLGTPGLPGDLAKDFWGGDT
jgi:hypothetical protein